MQTVLSPGLVGGAVAGLVLSLAAMLSLILGRRQLGATLRSVGARLFSQVGFFSIVIVVFLVVSVLESGQIINHI